MNEITKEHMRALECSGFKVDVTNRELVGFEVVMGEIETDRGTLEVYWGENNTVQLYKPNGTRKLLYEKTDAQVRRAIMQTIEANTYRK